MAGSGVCANTALAKQTNIKLEIKIDIVRTVLSLVSFESNHYLRPTQRIGCKKFRRILQQMTALKNGSTFEMMNLLTLLLLLAFALRVHLRDHRIKFLLL